jgi:hypothetical protein
METLATGGTIQTQNATLPLPLAPASLAFTSDPVPWVKQNVKFTLKHPLRDLFVAQRLVHLHSSEVQHIDAAYTKFSGSAIVLQYLNLNLVSLNVQSPQRHRHALNLSMLVQ